MTTAETRDLEVDGPLWDSHPVNAKPETHEARWRQLIQQASRRVKRIAEVQAHTQRTIEELRESNNITQQLVVESNAYDAAMVFVLILLDISISC